MASPTSMERRLSIEISNPRISSFAEMVKSNFAISVLVESSVQRVMPTPSLELPTTWHLNVLPVNHTPSHPTSGLQVSPFLKSLNIVSPSLLMGQKCNLELV